METFKNSNSDASINIIKQVYSGLNRNDVDSILGLFDEHVIRQEFEGLPTGGSYQGHIELRRNFVSGRSTWEEGSCEPIKFFSNGSKIIVTVHVVVRLRNEAKWIDAHVTDGFSFKDNVVSEFHSFTSPQKAFEWAGIPVHGEEL